MSATHSMHQVGPGFADPVQDAQRTFRALLAAMSEPGQLQRIGAWPEAACPAPSALDGRALHASTLATLLTLLDRDTPVDCRGLFNAEEIRNYLRFHCGARSSDTLASAFVLVRGPQADAALLEGLEWGSDEAPEAACTLIIEVDALELQGQGGAPLVLTLKGPGIEHVRHLAVRGPPAGFWRARRAMQRHFPRGIDLILCCRDRIAALPRSTQVDVEA
jgi:alpha-D-ribose 1-methylphosphonate 5-triphosphate synthase subunit PhnH